MDSISRDPLAYRVQLVPRRTPEARNISCGSMPPAHGFWPPRLGSSGLSLAEVVHFWAFPLGDQPLELRVLVVYGNPLE